MSTISDISAKTTHDLWVEARNFQLEISRPTPTSIELTVVQPTTLSIVDGIVVLVHTKPIDATNYPADGTQYSGSLSLNTPIDIIGGVDGAQVVAFYSNILNLQWPAGAVDATAGTTTWSLTITDTDPTQLYYASIHPCTNVLQYYPIGIQSYPLEGSRVEKGVSAYTGNIPSLPSAPVSPSVGMVYHDRQLNLVQYWTGSTWIPTRSDSILTGPTYPGVAGQVYLIGGATLKVFGGSTWTAASSANLLLKVPAPTNWAPLNSVAGVTARPTDPSVGDFIWNYTNQRPEYWDGTTWVYPTSANTLFNNGSGLIPAFVTPMSIEPADLPDPYIGQLFYNTKTKTLDAWTGSAWKQVNTDQVGTSSTDKIAIGTDGSYEERARLINVLKGQLGWPVVCVELKEEQFNIAIDNALDNYRTWSDGAYRLQYMMFQLIGDQQTYYLNSATDGTDRIVDIGKIHRLNVLGIQTANGNDAVWSSGILTSYYSAATVDMLSIHLISALSEEFERLFAGNLTFLWDEPSRELFITRKIYRNEKVIIECTTEKTEQEILVDRWSKQFIQNWALAELKMQLGIIRSKYSSGTAGATGNITMNGELLISEANQDMAQLKEACLSNFEFGGHVGQGNCSFLIG